MEQSLQHLLSPNEPDEMLAGFAVLLTLTFDLADAKAAADEVGEPDASDVHLPSRLARAQGDAVLGLQPFESFQLDQRDIAGVGVVVIAVAFEAATGDSHGRGHLMRHDANRPGQKNLFDGTCLFAHTSGHIVRLSAYVAPKARCRT